MNLVMRILVSGVVFVTFQGGFDDRGGGRRVGHENQRAGGGGDHGRRGSL
jgi:hypothetical protein